MTQEGKRFALRFFIYVLLEIILYTLVVYYDIFDLVIETTNPRKNPAITSFFGMSTILFLFFIVTADKKPKK
jgi:hypothetical protein